MPAVSNAWRRVRHVRPLECFIAVIATAGLAVVCSSLYSLPRTPHAFEWLLFGALALFSGRFALKIPGSSARFSVSDTFFVTSALLFGPGPATVAIAIDGIAMSYGRGWGIERFLFNFSAPAVSFWTGSQVFFLLIGGGPLYDAPISADHVLLPLAGMTVVYYVLNSGLLSIAVALEKRIAAWMVWRRHFAVVSLNYFAAASAAFFLLVVVQYLSLIALAAVIPLVAIFHQGMKSWTGRLEDANEHVATVDRLYLSTIEALSTAIEAKDGVTSSHIHRVQHYAMGLAHALGIEDKDALKAIQAAALLHDTGKLAVPERILNKPGKLTDAEFETMKLHVNVGADILSSIDFPYPVVPIVRAHHENWNGSGYPSGLSGSEIPMGARILSVVDCYDALTSDRPYRPAMTDEEALVIIRSRRGTFYDPVVVDVFERVCSEIRPTTLPAPQLQKALQQISRAAEPSPVIVAAPALAPVTEGPESLMALVNLARILEGPPTAVDVASVAWSHIRHVVPGASCAFFLADPKSDSVVAKFVTGNAGSVLQGLQMKLGDKLSGWVAANRQSIINSDAKLDLGNGAALAGLHYCVAVPLIHNEMVEGVLSLYSAEPFREEQTQTLGMVAPYLAQILSATTRQSDANVPAAARTRPAPLRIAASR